MTKKNTAELLKESALTLFGTYGYDGTSVRTIAKKAGVTAGQITAIFGSKENLLNEVIMEIYELVCSIYDPIIGEIEYLKKNDKLTDEDAWRLIEQIIDIQLDFVLDTKNLSKVRLLNLNTIGGQLRTTTKLAQITKSKIEDTLSELLRRVFKRKRTLNVKTVSRAVNGAIVAFGEHPELLLNDVLNSAHAPQSKTWMRGYLKQFLMCSLKAEAQSEPD